VKRHPGRGSPGQVAQDGQHPAVLVIAGAQPERFVDVRGVVDHCPLGDRHLAADRGVGPALGHKRQYLPLAVGEQLQRIILTPIGFQNGV
jgi:hypothetical protein